MQNYIREIKEKNLVPLRLDRNTVILVPPEKANEKYKARYLKNAERSRRMALNLGWTLKKVECPTTPRAASVYAALSTGTHIQKALAFLGYITFPFLRMYLQNTSLYSLPPLDLRDSMKTPPFFAALRPINVLHPTARQNPVVGYRVFWNFGAE